MSKFCDIRSVWFFWNFRNSFVQCIYLIVCTSTVSGASSKGVQVDRLTGVLIPRTSMWLPVSFVMSSSCSVMSRSTVWGNQTVTVFEKKSSWTRHIGMKTAFYTNMKKKIHWEQGTHKIGFSATVVLIIHFRIMLLRIKFIIKIIRTFMLLYICSKLLTLSRDALLKMSKTTSLKNLFDYDCMTLYIFI